MSEEKKTVDKFPGLLAFWDSEKNLPYLPNQVAVQSHKAFWWKCGVGHSWSTSVYARKMGTSGCPYCSNKKVLPGFNDLATVRADLASEWNISKNHPLQPTDLVAGAARKVWWECKEGHEWEATCNARNTRNAGCPYCSGRKSVQGKTDLATRNPSLADQWNQTKNGELLPSLVSPGSGQKVWWTCPIGHEWQAVVHKRHKGQGCPYCSGRSVLEGTSDISSRFPDTMRQWHPEKNMAFDSRQLSAGSKIKVWWICDNGHEFRQSPYERLTRGIGCPSCSTRVTVPGINDLTTTHPEVASEWHPSLNSPHLPRDFVAGSNQMAWWSCGEGHEWRATISSRAVRETGCPFCGNRKPWAGFNDLATTHPELADEWHPALNGSFDPSQIIAGSPQKAWWVCREGHEWRAGCASRAKGGGCPYCSNQKVLAGYNDLASKFPSLAREWDSQKNDPVAAGAIVFGSNRKAWWLCSKGHSWQASVASRSIRGTGCPSCGGRRLEVGENDFSSTDPDLAEQWHPIKNGSLSPSQVVASSKEKVWWLCPRGHEYLTSIGSRHAGKTGCPYCAGQKVMQGFNDLVTTHPHLVQEWHPKKNPGFLPTSVQRGTRRKAWWLCSKGHEWEATIANRVWGNACPYCAGQWVLVGENDLASKNPDLAREWHPNRNQGITPSDVFAASGKAYWWICSEGHEWKAKVSNRKWGNGCPQCSKAGYISTTPGLLYFIEHPELYARKIGITNVEAKKNRVKGLLKAGWVQIKTFQNEDGQLILDLETEILRWIRRDLGLPAYLGPQEMRSTGGASETFSSEGISNNEVLEKIEEVYQKLKQQPPY